MNFVCCIKQVPSSSKVDVDPVTGVLIRSSQSAKMNPYDLYALETSFYLKEQVEGSQVSTVSMGPPSAKKVLEESLSMGADQAFLLSDRAFAGADVLATSYALSQVIKTLDHFDVILCGKQTTDGDTAQVGPEIAEFLNIPHVPYVSQIIEVKKESLIVKSVLENQDEIIEVKYPCLITVEKGSSVPRLPSYKRKMKMKDYEIKTLTLHDLKDQDKMHYGLEGSPTQVEKIFPPNKERDSQFVKGNKKELAEKITAILKEKKFL